jgi:hypothetical protein
MATRCRQSLARTTNRLRRGAGARGPGGEFLSSCFGVLNSGTCRARGRSRIPNTRSPGGCVSSRTGSPSIRRPTAVITRLGGGGSTPLPSTPISSVARDPITPDWKWYVGTDVGSSPQVTPASTGTPGPQGSRTRKSRSSRWCRSTGISTLRRLGAASDAPGSDQPEAWSIFCARNSCRARGRSRSPTRGEAPGVVSSHKGHQPAG